MSEWRVVNEDMTHDEIRALTGQDNQVLAYEGGRYYNAWLEFDEWDGGYVWMDDADSEPCPTHICQCPEPPKP